MIIATMTAPLGAGALVEESTAGWWPELVAAEMGLIVLEAVIALVLGIGFTVVGGVEGLSHPGSTGGFELTSEPDGCLHRGR